MLVVVVVVVNHARPPAVGREDRGGVRKVVEGEEQKDALAGQASPLATAV